MVYRAYHRHEPPQENGLPLSFLHIADLFEVIVQLATKGDEVYITSVKGQPKIQPKTIYCSIPQQC